VLQALKEGEISPPFKTELGWHIAQLIETRAHDLAEQATRDKARETLKQKKYLEELQNWLMEIRNRAYVEVKI
jgi:peptidyl-prolyl cis-trans isomerase SurA